MNYRDKARDIIVSAEGDLRRLAEEALAERCYAEVAHIASLADGVSELGKGCGVRADDRPCEQTPVSPGSTHSKPRVVRNGSRPSNGAPRGYPRFERDQDKLVKIGWSKKAREIYEHRAPRNAVLAVARRLGSKVERGKTFAVDDLLPVPDDGGGELPSYQVYLTLAWMRHAGVIQKKGRDGYALRNGALADDELNKLWAELPERSA